MRRLSLCGLALVLGALLAVGGCRSPEGKAGRTYRIAVIPKGLTHEFWQSIHRGAERAAADLTRKGIPTEIIWDGPLREQDSLEQIRIVDRMISIRADGIVLAPQHSQIMVAPVKRAVAQHVPVVIIDSGLAREDIIVKYVATNNYHGGWLAAQHLLGVLEPEARKNGWKTLNLILFRYQVGSESTEKREQGFEDYVEKWSREQGKKKDGLAVNWVSRDKYAGATKDSAIREAAPLLNNVVSTGVRLDGIFAPNESSASGMLEAMRSLGLNKKVHLMGFDSSEPLLDAVGRGDVDGLILQDPYKMGYLGVWTLVHSLEGYDVTEGNRLYWETEQAVGGLPMVLLAPTLRGCDADNARVLGTGEYLITGDNVGERSTRELFNPELQQERNILAPVYVLKRRSS